MRLWALWTLQTVFPTNELWFGMVQFLLVTVLLALLAILAIPQVLALRQRSRVATLTATAESLQPAFASAAARLNRFSPLAVAMSESDDNADEQGRIRSWAIWAVQRVFPTNEVWFGLPQLLLTTVLLATLATLAVPHVLTLR